MGRGKGSRRPKAQVPEPVALTARCSGRSPALGRLRRPPLPPAAEREYVDMERPCQFFLIGAVTFFFSFVGLVRWANQWSS